ncbi:MAG: DUF1593 domain-containing protein [Planctomycetales bacterium]|nr:DUF1593 domain-containing protein [Planctomycetales bacterium]
MNRFLLLLCLVCGMAVQTFAVEKPRIIVTSDGEIDDQCSMIRFMLYTNECDVEGIISSSSQYHAHGHRWAGDDWIDPDLAAYAKVYPNLVKHDPAYPTPKYLRDRTLLGNVKSEGDMAEPTAGSNLIVKVLLDKTDDRPVWLQAWGGTNTIARALKTIEEEHPERMAEVAKKCRIFAIWEQDKTYQEYIRPVWGKYNILTIISDQFEAIAYRWKRAQPRELHKYFDAAWMKENILENHGPLCSIYASHDNDNEKDGLEYYVGDFRSEGDSPAFLHTIVNGLRNMESPDWGGWGGRYVRVRENTWLDPVPVKGYEYPKGRWYGSNGWGRTSLRVNSKSTPEQRREYFKPMWRWSAALQNDFAARADWCVKSYEAANHPPLVKLGHGVDLNAKPGERVKLNAEGSDPDGDQLHYRWWQYHEADTYAGKVEIANAEKNAASFVVPDDAKQAQTIHVICEVTDSGSPPLARYQRVVVEVEDQRLGAVSLGNPREGFSISCEAEQVTIEHDGELLARYHFRDEKARKPYFWPVIGPTGKSMTRAFPMKTVDGEQHDHPHHRGVWFAHQGVAGTDHWLEEASKTYKGDKKREFLASLGTIAHTSFTEISANEERAVIRSNNDYLDSCGKQLMADQRSMIFRLSDGKLVLDFDITLHGAYGDVELQDKKDAGLNVRIPTSMSLKGGKGHIVNSVGDRDGDTWSKSAAWVDYHGPVEGEHVGIAFLNHPSSFRHPTRWHVRDYGLFTANAFGPQSLDATEASGTFTLKTEESVRLRHRIVFHEGDEKAAGIAKAYQAYATSGADD